MEVWQLRAGFLLRRVKEEDATKLYHMVVEHAKLEDEEYGVTATEEDYLKSVAKKYIHAYFIQKIDTPTHPTPASNVQNNNADSTTQTSNQHETTTNIGILLYYFGFSSWKGKRTLFLEDIFIAKEYRKLGLGKDIMRTLANIAKSEDCPRIDWVVHYLNYGARGFYKRQGSKELSQWILSRIEDDSLHKLASSL